VDDYKKLRRVVRYLRDNKTFAMTLEVDDQLPVTDGQCEDDRLVVDEQGVYQNEDDCSSKSTCSVR
jgi:hypothetical protein